LAAARLLRGVDWLGLAASDVITSCCRCKGADAWEALFAACYIRTIDVINAYVFVNRMLFIKENIIIPDILKQDKCYRTRWLF